MRKSRLIDLTVGIASQVMLVGSGLIMLPFAVTRLNPAELAVWYLYLTIQALVALLDFGLTDTFIRFFSYVFSGVRGLKESELPTPSEDGQIDPTLLAALLGAARRIYGIMTAAAGFLMLTAGTWYIESMTAGADLRGSVWPSWAVFVLTMLAQTFFQWQSAPLIGSGRTRRNYVIAVRSRTVQVAATVLALWLYPSLTVMSCAFALGAIAMRIDYHLALQPVNALVAGLSTNQPQHGDLHRMLLRSARRLGSSVVGILLTNRLVALAVAWYGGLIISAQYAIANQALVALTSVAFVVQTMLGPKIANAGVHGDREAQRGLFSVSLVFGWGVYLVGGLCLAFLLPQLLTAIGSKTTLPNLAILALMIGLYALEMNMFTSTRMITTASNTVPYWRSMLVTGAAIVMLVLSAGQLGLGLAGILLAQLAPQLAYNYWHWPSQCFAMLQLRPRAVPGYALRAASSVLGRRG